MTDSAAPRTWSYWRAQLAPRKIAFVLLFHGLTVGIFFIGWWRQAADRRLAALNKLNFSVWMSRGAGLVLTFDILFLMLPMCRILLRWIRPKLRFLPLDESAWFHRQVAYSMLFWTVVHVAAHYVNFFNVEFYLLRPQIAVQVHYTTIGAVTGHIMLLCMFIMYTTSHEKIRAQSYETFRYCHHLFIPFLLAMYTHATGCFVRDSEHPVSPFAGKEFWDHCIGYQGWRWSLFGGGIYLIERLYREWSSRRTVQVVRSIKHPYDVVEIQFRKNMSYKPGQWLYLNVPSISGYQWHPFTITSCPFDPYIAIHVRQVGDFTRDLANSFGAGEQQAALFDKLDPLGSYEVKGVEEMPGIRVDGAYGAPAEDVFKNEVAVLIGAGIGVTPWASILKYIWHVYSSPNPPKRLKRIEFIWICRDTNSFEWFQGLLDSLEEQAQEMAEYRMDASGKRGPDFLRFHTYLTRAAKGSPVSDDSESDTSHELSRRTTHGRPNFHALLTGIRDGLLEGDLLGERLPTPDRKGKTRVGVYFCGPNMAAKEVHMACKDATVPEVKFKFWKEHF